MYKDFIKQQFPNIDLHLCQLEQEKWYETEKFPKSYDFKGFIDSDGKYYQKGDLEEIKVDYETVLFLNFLGWSNSTESNQLALFSHLFTSAESTYNAYKKKGHNILYNFENLKMSMLNNDYLAKKDIDAVVSRGGAIRNYNFSNAAKLSLTLQPLWEKELSGVVYDNEYLFKVPPPFLTSFFIKNFYSFHKKNFLIYPATVNNSEDKNQLGFAKIIEADVLKDHTILFCGPITSPNYAMQVNKILKDKGIQHIFLGKVPHGLLCFLYLISKGLILYSRLDFSPRVIPEALWAGLPFIINDRVVIAKDYSQFGWRCKDGDAKQLNSAIEKIINYTNHDKIHTHCKNNFTLLKNYDKIIKDINMEYQKGKV